MKAVSPSSVRAEGSPIQSAVRVRARLSAFSEPEAVREWLAEFAARGTSA